MNGKSEARGERERRDRKEGERRERGERESEWVRGGEEGGRRGVKRASDRAQRRTPLRQNSPREEVHFFSEAIFRGNFPTQGQQDRLSLSLSLARACSHALSLSRARLPGANNPPPVPLRTHPVQGQPPAHLYPLSIAHMSPLPPPTPQPAFAVSAVARHPRRRRVCAVSAVLAVCDVLAASADARLAPVSAIVPPPCPLSLAMPPSPPAPLAPSPPAPLASPRRRYRRRAWPLSMPVCGPSPPAPLASQVRAVCLHRRSALFRCRAWPPMMLVCSLFASQVSAVCIASQRCLRSPRPLRRCRCRAWPASAAGGPSPRPPCVCVCVRACV